ncbi:hypothetical protein LOTGIDRAFT_234926 [Lottia gigantea]|uniref:Beclin 1-associated autophagy-related key regulator n=1 Tax=Lottia gigantea TaxID=225164 RepID=V3ZTH2_LOTGI|nr:hypothetical protein LOTGIDRAFT_234926 [Lottia gigantea]ESO87677.1 hypothetical protein LOTGIDRAFT_234926 [Lottia gigantea]
MATSYETTEAPIYFHNSRSIDETAAITVAVERCPLCRGSDRRFYCQQCVSDGCFEHSNKRSHLNFRRQKKKWEEFKKSVEKSVKRVEKSVVKKEAKYEKLNEIEVCKQNIELLKQAIKTVKKETEKAQFVLQKTKEKNYQRKSKASRHSLKVTKIKEYIDSRGKITLTRNQETEAVLVRLQRERRIHLDVLTNYIFPISETHPSSADSLLISTASAIKDACQTAYVRGQWQYSDVRSDTIYRILEPTLPSNGNYSAYYMWVSLSKENNGTTPEQECGGSNLGHTFRAALCYCSQLLSILLYILDINHPKKQCYSEFCNDDITEKQLANSVNKLNHNVLYLCFSQGIKEVHLSPKDTLHNLYVLLQNHNIGRCIPFEVSEEMINSVMEGSSSVSDDSDTEPDTYIDEVGLGQDWEVPDNDLVYDLTSRDLCLNYPTHYSTQSSINEGGGLLASATTSIASFWQAARNTFERR